ncbi:MAG: glycoside hydrolase family 127 protein, partial [Chloroflexi bacterium]|nr:glycoside hydrolase family 127 protein [Chloroflexota bacterium]
VSVQRVWQAGDVLQLELPIAPRLVESTRGCVALERGPLVYCLEQADHPDAHVLDLAVNIESEIQDGGSCAELNGAITLKARGMAAHYEDWSDSTFRLLSMQQPAAHEVLLTGVPYYAWANREPGAMRVWIPRAPA